MSKKAKLLSVVMPVFNVADYLRKTIECIIGQTYTNWELLLVDDGSTDGCLDIEKEYCAKDERILFMQREEQPKGAPTCRNIGLKMAKGEYLIYLDSDDIIAPYCFQQRVDYMESHDCDFAVFPMMGFYEKFFDADGMAFGYKAKGDVVCALIARTLPFVVVSNIYKRESLINKHVEWDTNLKSFQDSDYNLHAIREGLSYRISNTLPDYFYRLSTQNSICKKLKTLKNCESQILFFKKQESIYGDDKRYKKALSICAALIFTNIIKAEGANKIVDDFVRLKLFEGKPIQRFNLKTVFYLTSKTTNPSKKTIIQCFFLPSFTIRYRLVLRAWYKRNNVAYNELKIRYYKELDGRTREIIEEKI